MTNEKLYSVCRTIRIVSWTITAVIVAATTIATAISALKELHDLGGTIRW